MSSPNKAEKVLLSPFEKHVKQALKLYAKPERLGTESPLARPYFLCNALASTQGPFESEYLGNTLCSEIYAAAQSLWENELPESIEAMLEDLKTIRQQPTSAQYAYVVLELRCFQQFLKPRRTSDIYEQDRFLPGSRSQHYRDFDVAVQKLSYVLLERLRPAIQLERPISPETLIGYEQPIEQAQRAVERGISISISGPGGVGKTSVGAHLLTQNQERPSFWYTLRPSLNDNLNTLLFALGHFLQGIAVNAASANAASANGASANAASEQRSDAKGLWRYIVASGGIPEDASIAVALLREDIATLEPKPLLCFDELEYLYAPDPEHQTPARVQIFELLESLQSLCPLVLISQRSIFDTEQHLQLTGLSTPHIAELWQRHGLRLDEADGERINKFTGGNPRLLLLCLSLQKSGATVNELLESDGQVLTLLPMFNRLWKRLVPNERRLLQRLSIYRTNAPEDAFPQESIEALVMRRLVMRDGRGGISLLPALREIIGGEISIEQAEILHQEAAHICVERAEYTAAAYHFWQGAQPRRAVQIWYPHRALELRRGQGPTAQIIFDGISRNSIRKREQKALDLIRAELHQRAGHLDEGLSNLEHQDWEEQSESTIRALQLKGELQEALGYPDAALESYGQAASISVRLLSRMVGLYQRRGMLHLRQKSLDYSQAEV